MEEDEVVQDDGPLLTGSYMTVPFSVPSPMSNGASEITFADEYCDLSFETGPYGDYRKPFLHQDGMVQAYREVWLAEKKRFEAVRSPVFWRYCL